MDKYNSKEKGTDGPGIRPKKNVGVSGDYKRGLKDNFKGNVEDHKRKGAGSKN